MTLAEQVAVSRDGDVLTLDFEPTPLVLARVRALPARRFDPTSCTWKVPYNQETWEAMQQAGFNLRDIPRPTSTGYAVDARKDLLKVMVPYSPVNTDLCRRIPDHRMWDSGKKAWYCKATPRNLRYLRDKFPQAVWSVEAEALYERLVTKFDAATAKIHETRAQLAGDDSVEVLDYKFGGPQPFAHQRRAFLLSRDAPAFALLMEQRTGKSKVIVDTAAWLYKNGKIDAVLVLAPNGVKTNWVTDEVPTHMPSYIPWAATYWSSGAPRAHRAQWQTLVDEPPGERLRWLVVNIEALSNYQNEGHPGELMPVLRDFLRRNRTLMVIDESTRIKKPSANRTKAALALGKLAPYRRILTGTPITQGPLDVYTPFKFLDQNILGFGSMYSFRNHFAILGGWNGKEVLGYQHLDELQQLIKGYSFRVLRDECLDLPPKRFQRLTVTLAPKQRALYDQMRSEMIAELGGGKATVQIVLTQMMRLQQIAGGFVTLDPTEDGGEHSVAPVPGSNPKLEALLDYVAEEQRKVIVWARFRPEIEAIASALRAEYGVSSVVEFHGGVNDTDRIIARRQFQDPKSPVRFFVGQQGTGGIGITLTQAKTVIFYSNTFSLEERKQAEDRPEGIGQTESVTYVDIVAADTVDDKKIIPALRSKQNIATQVNGDNWKEWI